MPFPLTFPDPFANDFSLNWEDVEDAIRAWVLTGSGFEESRVWWRNQKIPQGQTDFCVIGLGELIPLGAFDGHETLTDLTRDDGQEIEIRVRGERELRVTVQTFSDAVTGNGAAKSVLSRIQASLGLPTIRKALNDAGLSPFDRGSITDLTALVGPNFEGRASLDCRFYLRETLSEYTGYIETVDAESYLGPPDEGTRDDIDI